MSVYGFEPPAAPAPLVEVCCDDACDCKTVAVKRLTFEQFEALDAEAHSALVRSKRGLVWVVLVALLFWAAVCSGLTMWLV